ncbi:MAG TPA: hypothetical protein VH231_02815 [Solirubrobacteraceae bacterium]|nr:hypothetical protein [Solirubrobacteraceae bacterium]
MVDDAQWLDAASAQILGFVARRLLAESIAIVFAAREPSDEHELAGLSELRLTGVDDEDAHALLASVVSGRLDAPVSDRIVAETRGNPLALLELSRGMTSAELAGGFALPDAVDVPAQIEDRYRQRIDQLPATTQQLMLLAAADPVGDAALLWRAAARLGLALESPEPAGDAELMEIGAQVRFRHPLVRSAGQRDRHWRDQGRARIRRGDPNDERAPTPAPPAHDPGTISPAPPPRPAPKDRTRHHQTITSALTPSPHTNITLDAITADRG